MDDARKKQSNSIRRELLDDSNNENSLGRHHPVMRRKPSALRVLTGGTVNHRLKKSSETKRMKDIPLRKGKPGQPAAVGSSSYSKEKVKTSSGSGEHQNEVETPQKHPPQPQRSRPSLSGNRKVKSRGHRHNNGVDRATPPITPQEAAKILVSDTNESKVGSKESTKTGSQEREKDQLKSDKTPPTVHLSKKGPEIQKEQKSKMKSVHTQLDKPMEPLETKPPLFENQKSGQIVQDIQHEKPQYLPPALPREQSVPLVRKAPSPDSLETDPFSVMNRTIIGANFADNAEYARDTFSHNYQFFSMLIAYFIGFSNLTLFPLNMAKHGGLWYLLPYSICCVVYVLPAGYIETFIGQFIGAPPIVSYPLIAPILKVTAWADATIMLLGILSTCNEGILSGGILQKGRLNFTLTSCTRESDINCFSLDTELQCFNETKFIRKNCLPEDRRTFSTVTTHNADYAFLSFYKDTISSEREETRIHHFNKFYLVAFLSKAFFTCFVGVMLTLPVRHVAKVVLFLEIICILSLICLSVHLNINAPVEFLTDKQSEVTKPSFRRLLHLETWAAALEHCLLSNGLMNSEMTTLAALTNRKNRLLKWVLLGMSIDFFMGIVGILIAVPAARALQVASHQPITFLQIISRNSMSGIHYVLASLPQVLSFYKNREFWTVCFVIGVSSMFLATIIAIQFIVQEFFKGLFGIKKKWHTALLTATFVFCLTIVYNFRNEVLLFNWTLQSRQVLFSWSLAAKQVILIGAYGAQQMMFDMAFTHRKSKTFFGQIGAKVADYSRILYFYFNPLITIFFIYSVTTLKDWTNPEYVPFVYLQKRPFLAAFVNPAMVPVLVVAFCMIIRVIMSNDKMSIFRVQPEHPSFPRIRVPLEQHENADDPAMMLCPTHRALSRESMILDPNAPTEPYQNQLMQF